MASIASQGVLQNLVVVPQGRKTFGVVAGGRRLRALKELVKHQTLPADFAVPCRVTEPSADITEISLAENVGQEAMHPADQYEAFAALAGQGVPVEDIAGKFGVSRQVVQKRLALGRVAPALLDAYRRNDITLDCLMAFTVTDDHERQLACYRELSGRLWPHAVKNWLLGEAVDARRGIGAFVGKAAYLKAGGAGAGDLFEDTFYLCDSALVCELAQAKLTRAAKQLAKAESDWLWIDTAMDRHQATEGLRPVQAEHVGVPEALTQQIEAQERQISAWEDLYYDDTLAEGFDDEESFYAALEAAHTNAEALDAQRDEYLQFTAAQRGYSGCIVTFDNAGKLEVLKGWARTADLRGEPDREATDQAAQGDETPQQGAATLSQALINDLGQYRQQATKATLLGRPPLALDILHYSLCVQVLGGSVWEGKALLDATFAVVDSQSSRGDTGEGNAFDALTDRSGLSLEWLNHDDGAERFAAFIAQPKKAKDKQVAFAMALCLRIGVRGQPEQDALVEQLEVDFPRYWRPNAANYFSRLTKPQLLEHFGPVLGQAWRDWHADAKKSVIVDSLEERFAEQGVAKNDPRTTWVPEQF
jgi:ParB family chromosome partitioning protein